MLYKLRKIIEKQDLWGFDDHLLIAVSGGLDSMVLLDLCRQMYNPIAVVHCNFQLRGAEAFADEKLVQETCGKYKIPYHSKAFTTAEYAQENGISIEMSARDLRYAYFEELCQKHGYTKILTAHHANDNAETVLLNLTKGTGIKGLTGIPQKRDTIVRPLLSFTRSELATYAEENKLQFREDSTNKDDVFQRNKIRNAVVPLLAEINPAVVQTLYKNTQKLQEVRGIYEDFVQNRLQKIVQNNTILIEDLVKEKYPQTLLFEWLSSFGFSGVIAEEIVENLEDTEEKYFLATDYRLLKSRGKLIITEKHEQKEQIFEVSKNGIQNPICLEIQKSDGTIEKAKNKAYFDAEKLVFPLYLRRWKVGDRFVPFGMKGSKKVSELFKDKKLTTLEKENIWILCSGEKIIWVVGLRTSDAHKITAKTKNAITITWKK